MLHFKQLYYSSLYDLTGNIHRHPAKQQSPSIAADWWDAKETQKRQRLHDDWPEALL